MDFADAFVNETLPGSGAKFWPRYPIFYSLIYKSVGTVLHSLIFLLGVLGNLLVVVVVLKKRFLQTPVNYYIVSLAAADILVLLSAIPDTIASYYRPAHMWVLGTFGCKSLIFFQYLGINVSSASMLAFTMERYLAVCRPHIVEWTGERIGKVRRVIFGIWLASSIYCSPWFWLTETVPMTFDLEGYRDAERCDFKFSEEPYAYATIFITDLFLFYVIPLTICSLLYVKIGMVLYKSIRGSGSRTRRIKSDNGDSMELYSLATQNSIISSNRAKQIVRSRVQLVRMLGLVVFLFALLSVPYRGLMVYNCFAAKPWLDLWYLLFAKSCIFLNSAINPLLYNFMSSRFRLAFYSMLCKKRPVRSKQHGLLQ